MSEKTRLLEFLQTHKLDMMREIPGFIDARLNKDSDALVIRVAQPLIDELHFKDDEGDIPVQVKIDYPDSKAVEGKVVIGLGNNESADVEPQKEPSPETVGTVIVPLERTVGPHENMARNSEAYEAWKKRHNLKVKH